MATITGKTKSGFEFEYDSRILSDWRYIELLSQIQTGSDMEKVSATTKAVKLLVGEDKMQSFIDHVANTNEGYAPIEQVVAEFLQMVDANQKN